jgi:hypothetical protein
MHSSALLLQHFVRGCRCLTLNVLCCCSKSSLAPVAVTAFGHPYYLTQSRCASVGGTDFLLLMYDAAYETLRVILLKTRNGIGALQRKESVMRTIQLSAVGLACVAELVPIQARAQSCRAQQIIASQCTWIALEELGGDKGAAKRAEKLATSTPIDRCSPDQYQIVLLHGTEATQVTIARLRAHGSRGVATVRSECAAAASHVVAR